MTAGPWTDATPRLVEALGWVLLHFVWQGVLVGLLAALALALLRRAEPRRRHAVCALALAGCLAIPLAHLAWLLFSPDPAPSPTSLAADPAPSWLAHLQARLPALVTAWSLGVGLMTLRLASGLAWVARMRRRALAVPPAWQQRMDALARRLALRRPVLLRQLDGIDSPLTVPGWRPMVLLPVALVSGMPVPLLEALLAHELAHVQRWDDLANLVQGAVEALLFFHPVVWWLSMRLRDEREQVADELAARALDDPRQLALALHALSSPRPPAAAAAIRSPSSTNSARGGHLYKRIERLVAPQPRSTSWKLALPALALAGTSLIVQADGDGPRPPKAEPVVVVASANANADAAAHASAAALAIDPATPAAPVRQAAALAANVMHLPVNARHVLVLDADTGRTLFAKDPEAVVPIASLSKLVTAMVLLDAKFDPDARLRIDRDDVDTLKHSRSLVAVGAEMSREAALELALVASENRAAAALARTYPGGMGAFMQALQAKVHSLGLAHTTLVEPTGLSPSNTSTAEDVARIVAAAAGYPDIARITSERTARIDVNGRPRELHNTNLLVGHAGWDIHLSKTGYTDEAGRCLTMRLRSGDRDVTVVLLDADGSAQRLRDATRIRQSLARLPALAS
jgi:D-alanyl-D-alanine endopeptidase (penicillin-binding protein 7)